MPVPDLEIKSVCGGGGGGGWLGLGGGGAAAVSKKFFSRPFGPQFGPKIRGGGASPGSATDDYALP